MGTKIKLNIESRLKKQYPDLNVLFACISKIYVQKIQNNLEGMVYYQDNLIYGKGFHY